MPDNKIDKVVREIFIGDGPCKDLLRDLIGEVEESYKIVSYLEAVPPEDEAYDIEYLAGFSSEITEKLNVLSLSERQEIKNHFIKRVKSGVFMNRSVMTEDDCIKTREKTGPFFKWLFIYWLILYILVPDPCATCQRSCANCAKKNKE